MEDEKTSVTSIELEEKRKTTGSNETGRIPRRSLPQPPRKELKNTDPTSVASEVFSDFGEDEKDIESNSEKKSEKSGMRYFLGLFEKKERDFQFEDTLDRFRVIEDKLRYGQHERFDKMDWIPCLVRFLCCCGLDITAFFLIFVALLIILIVGWVDVSNQDTLTRIEQVSDYERVSFPRIVMCVDLEYMIDLDEWAESYSAGVSIGNVATGDELHYEVESYSINTNPNIPHESKFTGEIRCISFGSANLDFELTFDHYLDFSSQFYYVYTDLRPPMKPLRGGLIFLNNSMKSSSRGEVIEYLYDYYYQDRFPIVPCQRGDMYFEEKFYQSLGEDEETRKQSYEVELVPWELKNGYGIIIPILIPVNCFVSLLSVFDHEKSFL